MLSFDQPIWKRVSLWTTGVLSALGLFLLLTYMAVRIGQTYIGPLTLGDPDDSSVTVLDRNGRLLRAFTTAQGRWRLPVAVKNVDRRYLAMLLAYEDGRFYRHHGVDPLAMARAAWQLIRHGRVVSGASTLTMQVARLLEPRDRRTIRAKTRQMLRALQLEAGYSKREILELYLKIAPFGGNLEGVRAASLAWFGREPKRLTMAQSALLVALPQSPTFRRPDRNGKAAKTARDRVLNRAARAGVITAADARMAQSERMPVRRRAFPKYAAHLAQARLAQLPAARTHRLTIERDLQARLELLARGHARTLGPKHSVAIIAADHKTGEVLAHVGSPDFLDEARSGPIDMALAVRSPGSALKPFIYGLAFEEGMAHPETLIEDLPARFGRYQPKNFGGEYRGTVTVREALQLSLNVPAVKLLHKLGPTRLLARFARAGVSAMLPGDTPPNLSIALGGLGLRLVDLTTLYTGLARGGEAIELKYDTADKSSPEPAAPRLLGRLAAWYVADILAGAPPPANARGGRIAYKTGTSYGFRDAWAVGFDGRHVIAVWAGQPDGAASPGMTGRKAAAPILFDAFARLSTRRVPLSPPPADALASTTAGLPPPLRRFEPTFKSVDRDKNRVGRLRIVFPPGGARLDLSSGGGLDAVALKATGGQLPLTWLVNDAPVAASSRRRDGLWKPDGKGFAKLGVIDAAGQADSVLIRVE